MLKSKPIPRIERKRHFHAFEVYRDLGYGRTLREVSRQVNASPTTITQWRKWYRWDERLAEYNEVVATKKEEGALLKIDSPIAQKVVSAMEQIEALINSAFLKDVTGRLSPKNIKIKSVDELSRLVAEYRKFLEVYHRFVAEYQPAKKEKDRGTHIKEFNVHMEGISQEERIAIMKGLSDGNESGGDKQSAGGIQEADYTEISERGDAD